MTEPADANSIVAPQAGQATLKMSTSKLPGSLFGFGELGCDESGGNEIAINNELFKDSNRLLG